MRSCGSIQLPCDPRPIRTFLRLPIVEMVDQALIHYSNNQCGIVFSLHISNANMGGRFTNGR